MTDLTRRRMLGVAAGTMASAVGTSLPEPAAADDAADLALFVRLSVALTGIAEARLAPSVDPIGVKNDYFDRAKSDPDFPSLMQIVRTDPANPPVAAAAKIMSDPKLKFLGRSIILTWYLGAWYQPKLLAEASPPFPMPHKVISPAAYTQAWTWRVAQTHPMGYSELRFGYWSDDPLPLGDFITV
jgi:Membrane bound FAD containing D-sorbitol dehydrogenase